ncbi:hypothetical protein [uncultured Pseudoalteromonas sp.]|uniref:hypothetical protein n=1 Tax=uncultured Pseudoalteromonas sp. TaxID=114053 RepID=UPI0030C8B121
MSRYIVIGSSNVIFTHSYCLGLNDRSLLSGYIDTGKHSIKYPSYLKEINTLRLYNNFEVGKVSFKRRLIKSAKLLLKILRLDQSRLVTNLINNHSIEKVDRKKRSEIESFLEEENINNFLYLWSTTVKDEKTIIDDIYPNNKSVLIVNTYPVRSNNRLDENCDEYSRDAQYFNSFDRLLVPTILMKDLLCDKCFVDKTRITVMPDYLHPKMYPTSISAENLNKRENKKIVFLGTTNFSERTIDDISSLVRELSNSNIEVHLQGDPAKSSKMIKYFLPFDYDEIIAGKLSHYIKDFDGVLVAYNNLNNARSNISYPTRYALGLLSNRPIYMKEGVFKAIENNDIITTYTSTDDLVEKIKSQEVSNKYDRDHIKDKFNMLIDAVVGDT